MRKFTLLLLVWLVGCLTVNSQTIVTIGAPATGAGSTNVLLSTSTTTNKYSKTISIYTASEILTAGGFQGDITSIAWDKQGTGEYTFNDATMVVYMKHITNNDWAVTPDWSTELVGATQVFSSTTFSLPTGTGWKGLTFTSPFQWDGASNIAVFVDWYRPSTPTASIDWGRSTYNDGNATRVGSSANLVLSVNNNRPLVQFGMFPATPCTVPPAAGAAQAAATNVCPGGTVGLLLTGNSYGVGQTYQWEHSSSINGPWTPEGSASSSASIVVTPPVGVSYYRCQVTCGASSVASVADTVVVSPPFSGAYTINSTLPASATNFQSLSAALSIMSCAGMSGPVSFTIAPGTGPYNEQLIIDSVPGVSAVNRIVIDGNGETVSNSASGSSAGLRPTVKLNGADYVTLKNLVIDANGATYGWGVQIGYGAEYDSILNCTIHVASTSATQSSTGGIIGSGSETSVTADGMFNNIAIIGNTITGGYQGITLNGTAASPSVNNYIANNTIRDYYADGLSITSTVGAVILNNDFSRPLRSSSTTHTGIELGAGNIQASVSKNKIHGTHTSTASQNGITYGIHVTSCDAPVGQENIIANNLIYDFNSGTGTQYGLRNSGSNGAYFYHNTVVLDNAASTAGSTYGFYQTTTATNIEVKNNIFYITRGGSGSKYCVYFNTVPVTSDNNVLYMGSGSGNNYIGNDNNTDYASLSAWQGANFDFASSDQDPYFASPSTLDFTTTNSLVNNIAAYVPQVTDDITGKPRGSAPDPGAFENNDFPLDVKLLRFDVTKQQEDVSVKWSVAAEKNMSIYEVERSEDGRSFTRIGSVKAMGNDEERAYQYTDEGIAVKMPANGKLYYRLKMVEENNTYNYSPVQTVRLDEVIGGVSISPNPFNEKITVRLNSKEDGQAIVRIVDLQGKVLISRIMTVRAGANSLDIRELQQLPGAIYHIIIDINGIRYTQQLVK